MVVKNQKNLIHDVVMNFIPKKKIDPPKVSLEQMVREHTKQNTNIKNNLHQIEKSNIKTNFFDSKESINIINEIENEIKDNPITISKVERAEIADIIMSIGGEIQKKYNSRKRSRNHVKSTVEKLIDTKLKSEFIENFKNNNTINKVIVEKAKSPSINNIKKSSPHLIKSLSNKTYVDNSKKIPNTKKYKSETNTNQKTTIHNLKEQLLQTNQRKKYNSLNNNINTNKNSNIYIKSSHSKKKQNFMDNKKINRTNNYINNNNQKKKESEISSNAFRNYEIKIKKSRKNSKKNEHKKKSKKYRTSKKSKSKTKSLDVFNNIKLEKGIPNYLKNDLKQLIGNNIKIHSDNFIFN